MNDFPDPGGEGKSTEAPSRPDEERKKGGRRRSREAALQALFFMDLNPAYSVDTALALFLENFPVPEGSQAYFRHLVQGVWENKKAVDRLIRRSTEHWRLERMSTVDRNILRIGVFELVYCPDIPPRVAINEAIDLGKRFGNEESGAFINGILDRVFAEQAGKKEGGEAKEAKERTDPIGS